MYSLTVSHFTQGFSHEVPKCIMPPSPSAQSVFASLPLTLPCDNSYSFLRPSSNLSMLLLWLHPCLVSFSTFFSVPSVSCARTDIYSSTPPLSQAHAYLPESTKQAAKGESTGLCIPGPARHVALSDAMGR